MIVKQSEWPCDLPKSYEWAASQLDDISQRFIEEPGTPNGFPCVFGHNAFKRKLVYFSLIPSAGPDQFDLNVLTDDVGEYLEHSKSWDGDVNTHNPLLVVFQAKKTAKPTEFYKDRFVEALQHLIDVDDVPWPSSVVLNATHHSWTMCFKGIEIFVNVSHPNHVNRRSRNLGEGMVFVLNPRQRFDVVAPANRQGHLIEEKIRSNIDVYDRIPRSRLLGSYAKDEHQWHQYMLPDDNESPALQCPLRFK